METPKSAPSPGMQLLLLGEQNKRLDALQKLLQLAGNGHIEVDSANSLDEVRVRLRERSYAVLLCDGGFDEASISQMLSPKIGLPVVFLSGLDEFKLQSEIASAFCPPQGVSQFASCCVALAVFGAIAKHRKESQRQNSEEMLHKLRATVEQSPDLAMITNYAGVVEYVNPAFETLTGYSREEVIGQTLGVLKSEQQSGEFYEEMWDTVLSGRAFHGVVMNRKKNGQTFILEKAITPLHNPQGQITHFISTGRDITDQRRLEGELQQVQKMDVVGRLAGGVAHDFNNLLMVISAYAELMLDVLSPEHPLRQNVGEIMGAARRAADLTRQLLAFGRKQVQSLQVLDLNTVIREITQMLPRLIGEDIQLVFIAGPNLGKVEADPVQIEQVVMNLAANGRDAMPHGGKLTIETANLLLEAAYSPQHATVPPGDYVMITVTDLGQGILPEHLPHIFEPFYTTKEEGKGTGLGLATVYGIVKQTGGFVRVFSEPGMSTSFKIYLPRVLASAKRSMASTAAPDSPHGYETVLLVEDESAVRQSTRQFLTRNGYTVLEASNGEEALRVSRDYCGTIHMMISDVVMPKMSGPILAEQLSAERPHMKTLFVSGYAENTVLRHGEIDLSTCFLQKPFGLSALAQKTRAILDAAMPSACAAAASD
jgi:two-component system cell cycle sensor histidine kinase/response regulator CckA